MKHYRHLKNVALLELDKDVCIGCGVCAKVCPHEVFAMEGKKAHIVDHDGCMECGACATNCPVEALTVNPSDGCGCAVYIIRTWLKGEDNVDSSCC